MAEEQPDLRPRENQIIAEPATPEACREDFEAGAADRATSAKQQAHAEHR